jgi:hypothetical protein
MWWIPYLRDPLKTHEMKRPGRPGIKLRLSMTKRGNNCNERKGDSANLQWALHCRLHLNYFATYYYFFKVVLHLQEVIAIKVLGSDYWAVRVVLYMARSMFEINITACHIWGRGFDSRSHPFLMRQRGRLSDSIGFLRSLQFPPTLQITQYRANNVQFDAQLAVQYLNGVYILEPIVEWPIPGVRPLTIDMTFVCTYGSEGICDYD